MSTPSIFDGEWPRPPDDVWLAVAKFYSYAQEFIPSEWLDFMYSLVTDLAKQVDPAKEQIATDAGYRDFQSRHGEDDENEWDWRNPRS